MSTRTNDLWQWKVVFAAALTKNFDYGRFSCSAFLTFSLLHHRRFSSWWKSVCFPSPSGDSDVRILWPLPLSFFLSNILWHCSIYKAPCRLLSSISFHWLSHEEEETFFLFKIFFFISVWMRSICRKFTLFKDFNRQSLCLMLTLFCVLSFFISQFFPTVIWWFLAFRTNRLSTWQIRSLWTCVLSVFLREYFLFVDMNKL